MHTDTYFSILMYILGVLMYILGVSEAMVQFGESTKPTITIKIDGKIFFYKSMYSPERGFQYECTYDEPFDQTTTDGRQVKVSICKIN